MVQLIKEKKKERLKLKDEVEQGLLTGPNGGGSGGPKYSQEELERLQYQLKEAE